MAIEATSRRADFSEIPVIDLAELGRASPAEVAVVDAIRHACENVGFFYVANHGVDQVLLEEIFAQCRRFFSLPQADRDALLLTNSPHYRGYLPIGARGDNKERPRDLLESFNVARELDADDPFVALRRPLHGPNQWPDGLPGFREFILRYYAAMEVLMMRLLEGTALAMGLKRDALFADYRKPLTQMRLLHYPSQEGEIVDNMIGARAHRDFGVLTILLQDEVGGLEVLNNAGEWVVAPPLPGTLIVNLGLMMRHITNDHYLAAEHRVINRYGKERYSVPFFINPDYDAVIAPLPHFVAPGTTASYQPAHAGEMLHNFYRNLWPSAGQKVT
jgi:isopenicillin N synthase-like dioxygenase